jgi:hypothetical protein
MTSDNPPNPDLRISWPIDRSSENLNSRIARLRDIDKPVQLDGYVGTIQFLRGVWTRSTYVLPALYLAIGSKATIDSEAADQAKRMSAAQHHFSSLLTISLCCRSIFDEGNGVLTGKRFANVSDSTLGLVASFWAEQSNHAVRESRQALGFLRDCFRRCSRPRKDLLDGPSLLERRVGLLKYHADRQAAHISLEPFLFHTSDLIHVTASMAILGALITEFDEPTAVSGYFDSLDIGGWRAAKEAFPALPIERVFKPFAIHDRARAMWTRGGAAGLEDLLNELPLALGIWDSSSDDPVY